MKNKKVQTEQNEHVCIIHTDIHIHIHMNIYVYMVQCTKLCETQTHSAARPIIASTGDQLFGHYGVLALWALAFYNKDTSNIRTIQT